MNEDHDTRIRNVERDHAALKQRVDSLEARMDRHHGELMQSLARVEKQLEDNTRAMDKAEGGLRVGMWIAGAAATIAGLFIAAWKALT